VIEQRENGPREALQQFALRTRARQHPNTKEHAKKKPGEVIRGL
jgi:hypothetical protein